jgi:hypothetical protein
MTQTLQLTYSTWEKDFVLNAVTIWTVRFDWMIRISLEYM